MTTILYENSFASHEKAAYWSEKNDTKPNQITKGSTKKYLFNCDKCGHEFLKQINLITKLDSWCSYCSNNNLCDDNNCKICFDKSFASHEKSKYWSNKNELKPRQVFKVSAKKYLFDCSVCKHEIINNPSHISNGRWCPYCCVPQKKLCGIKECSDCYNKSFASHEKIKYWSPKNTENPRHLFQGDHNRYWFNCNNCNHDFDIRLYNVKSGYWCPYCAHQKLCDDNECTMCFNNSFASHPKSIHWTSQNMDKPRNVFQKISKKYWFNCNKCNLDFYSSLREVSSGCWCPFCVNKTETIIYNILKEIYPSLLCQFKQEWCKNITYLPFDFCIPENKIIIELDGPQHFRQISNWSSPEEQFDKDKYKEKCANDNDYSVIRLIQEDVFNDTYDWFKELCTSIEEIKNGDKIMNVYLCKNGEYDTY